jgi:hypothetical protein
MTSEMYLDTQTDVVNKASSARECAVCHGTANPNSSVFMPKAEVTICAKCNQDLYRSLSPKVETIPVSRPTHKPTVSTGLPFSQERFKRTYVEEASRLLLGLIGRK